MTTLLNQPAAPPFWLPLSTGRLYDSQLNTGASTTVAVAANTLYAAWFFVPASITLSNIGIEVTTLSAGNVRMGIYSDSAGVPSALVTDAGTASTSTTGYKSIATSQVLTPGHYWLAAVFSATPTVRAMTATNAAHWLGFTSGTDTTVHAGWSVAFTYAALPNPFTGGGALMTTNPPRLMVAL